MTASDANLDVPKISGANPPKEPPTTGTKVLEVADVALRGFDTALCVLSKVSSVFPPLQAPVEGLIACIDVFKVSSCVFRFWLILMNSA